MASCPEIYVVRQALLLTAICLMSLTAGMQIAFPAVLNPAILAPEADIKATSDQASWIATSLGIGGLVGYTIIPVIFAVFGRKKAMITMNLCMFTGSLTFYIANDVISLALARFTQGLSLGGSITSAMTLCECIPSTRRYFVVLDKVSVGIGSLFCHVLGYVLNWRQIAVYSAFPNFISILLFMNFMESPSYLAMQGQFDNCSKAFKWYRGESLEAKKELNELLIAQTESFRNKQTEQKVNFFKKYKIMLMTKEFRKSFFIVTLATLCIDTSGKTFLPPYITQILLELTNNRTVTMYTSVTCDCILIFALCISSILVKRFKRRTLLFKFGFCSVFMMFMVSLSIVMRKNFTFMKDVLWLTPTLLLLHTLITNLGLVPSAFSLTGEVFPLDQRGLGSFLSGVVFLFFLNLVLKLTPVMIESTGVEGTYAIYGSCLFTFLVLLQFILPETKDKTLQQIEDEIKGVVRNKSETELLNYSRAGEDNTKRAVI